MTTNQEAIRRLFKVAVDNTGNLPSNPGIYPDYAASIVRDSDAGRELALARWGMPTPPQFLTGKKSDSGATNIRNPNSQHLRRWLNVESRCLVPFTSFAEPDNGTFGGKAPVWFAFDDTRPLDASPGSGPVGHRFAKSRKGERPTTSSASTPSTRTPRCVRSIRRPCPSSCERRKRWIRG